MWASGKGGQRLLSPPRSQATGRRSPHATRRAAGSGPPRRARGAAVGQHRAPLPYQGVPPGGPGCRDRQEQPSSTLAGSASEPWPGGGCTPPLSPFLSPPLCPLFWNKAVCATHVPACLHRPRRDPGLCQRLGRAGMSHAAVFAQGIGSALRLARAGGVSPAGRGAPCPPALGLLWLDAVLTSILLALGTGVPGDASPGDMSPHPPLLTASRFGGTHAPAGCQLPVCVSGCLPTPAAQGYKAAGARHVSASRDASGTRSMESAWLCLLCLLGSGLILPGTAELGVRPAESLPGQSREQPELVEVLQELLEKLGSPELPALEKRLSWVPSCQPGEPCAVRRGARIGKLCSCPRGTACNLFLLKCS
uniref:Cocaine- and amphetamine-regulated transcript protein n=1 Tax=Falco tinnunculus TaxID=100819 RepID=A0A8C4XPC3_FALTI